MNPFTCFTNESLFHLATHHYDMSNNIFREGRRHFNSKRRARRVRCTLRSLSDNRTRDYCMLISASAWIMGTGALVFASHPLGI